MIGLGTEYRKEKRDTNIEKAFGGMKIADRNSEA
jgi:hypothetical protein